MLNYIWLGLVVLAVVLGGINGSLGEVTQAALERAEYSVMKLALPLAGIMVLWLGLMRLAERAGLVQAFAKLLRPLLRRLFPDVPVEHPAMGSMVMNMAANMLGLANAATPIGLRAMKDLETLNQRPGTASNAMCTFLAINTSSVQLLPMTAIAILYVNGSVNPTSIVAPALLATLCSTVAGITMVKWLEKWPIYRLPALTAAARKRATPSPSHSADQPAGEDENSDSVRLGEAAPLRVTGKLVMGVFLAFFVWLFLRQVVPGWNGGEVAEAVASRGLWVRSMNAVSVLAIPFLIAIFPLYAALKRVKVYEEFVEGGKEGFQVAVRIIPYLVAILVAAGMFRAAGGIEIITRGLNPVLDFVGFPSELVPMCLMRPLSGSGTLGMFTDLVETHGADSLVARMGGAIVGSTETTLYVVAVYFGAVAVRRSRHAVPAGLFADLTGMIASVLICRWMFG